MFKNLKYGILLLSFSTACFAEYKTDVLNFTDFEGVTSIEFQSQFYGYQSAVDRDYTDGEPAYDYSCHLIKTGEDTGERLRLFTGGRWRISSLGSYFDGDHILQHTSPYGQAGTWDMWRTYPDIWKGDEEGAHNAWYSNNVLEPEVVFADGVWYMFTQVEIDPGQPIDIAGLYAQTQADRIQLHTSMDCINWTRWTERGVIVNVTSPTTTFFHHQEVIYVPWDTSPWWLYVAVNVDNTFYGYYRIKSTSPTTFDWGQRQPAGLAQLGNQIGYLRQAPGGPLFVRITFADDGTGRTVPSMQFSRDGLNWFWGNEGPVKLAGSTDNNKNKNCYFLGLSTLNGTGQLEYLDNYKWKAFYAASTSNSPAAPDIYYSEIGVGDMYITIHPCAVDFGDLAQLCSQWLFSGDGLSADLNNDKKINSNDYVQLASHWQAPCPANWTLK